MALVRVVRAVLQSVARAARPAGPAVGPVLRGRPALRVPARTMGVPPIRRAWVRASAARQAASRRARPGRRVAPGGPRRSRRLEQAARWSRRASWWRWKRYPAARADRGRIGERSPAARPRWWRGVRSPCARPRQHPSRSGRWRRPTRSRRKARRAASDPWWPARSAARWVAARRWRPSRLAAAPRPVARRVPERRPASRRPARAGDRAPRGVRPTRSGCGPAWSGGVGPGRHGRSSELRRPRRRPLRRQPPSQRTAWRRPTRQ